MAKQKLFNEPQKRDDQRQPHERFADLAKRVVNTPKAEVDDREERWKRERKKVKHK